VTEDRSTVRRGCGPLPTSLVGMTLPWSTTIAFVQRASIHAIPTHGHFSRRGDTPESRRRSVASVHGWNDRWLHSPLKSRRMSFSIPGPSSTNTGCNDMAQYQVVDHFHVGWEGAEICLIERTLPGELSVCLQFKGSWAMAQLEADRLNALAEAVPTGKRVRAA
jgi:hypothetical protein